MTTFCGTAAYLAPEMVTGVNQTLFLTISKQFAKTATDLINFHSKLTQHSKGVLSYGLEVDMWSCGVILYMLLSGYHPFTDFSEGDTARSHFHSIQIFWSHWEIYIFFFHVCYSLPTRIFGRVKKGLQSFKREHGWGSISVEAKDLIRKVRYFLFFCILCFYELILSIAFNTKSESATDSTRSIKTPMASSNKYFHSPPIAHISHTCVIPCKWKKGLSFFNVSYDECNVSYF